jgi:hypothetical protein
MPDSPAFDPSVFTPEMSGKFSRLIEKIRELDAVDMRDHGTLFKHFIFTDIRESAHGAKALAAFMIAAGFELRMKVQEKFVKRKGKLVKTKTGETVFVHADPVANGSNGFAMLQSLPLWKNALSVPTKKEIIKIYNSRPDNVHGELLRVAILDSKFKEGIDLFDVKYVHLLEPPIATSDLKQAVGRATRFCGQKGLAFAPRRGWPLEVFIYSTILPGRKPFALDKEQKIDAHDLMLANSGLDLAMLHMTKELTILGIASAVDYDLNFKINNFDIESALLEATDVEEILIAEVTQNKQTGGAQLVTILKPEDITPAYLAKCQYGRKSKLFPFTNKQLLRVALRMGIPVPKRAKRADYCSMLKTEPAYLEAMLRPASISTDQSKNTPLSLRQSSQPPNSTSSASTEELLTVRDLFAEPKARTLTPKTTKKDAETMLASIKNLPFDSFQAEIANLYRKYKWTSPVVKNGCDAIVAGKPGTPVSFTQTQDFVRHYLTPKSPYKGLLAWHSVGTGKTCMAVAAATTQFEQAGYTILWVTRNSLMADVYKNIFGSVCSIPIMEDLEKGAGLPKNLAKQKRMLSRAWLAPISYRTFQNALEKKNELGRMLHKKNSSDPLHKTFLIMDEIHKLQDGDLSAAEAADFGTIQKYIHASYDKSGEESVRPLLMTATPITDSPKEMFEILNTLIADKEDRFMPFEEYRQQFSDEYGNIAAAGRSYFQKRAQGLISYLNREFDPTTFAQPKFHTITVPVGEALLPAVTELVDSCLRDIDRDASEDLSEESCLRFEDELADELEQVAASGLPKKEIRSATAELKRTYKVKKAECLKRNKALQKTRKETAKLLLKNAKKCYAMEKKSFTKKRSMAQINGVEACFKVKGEKSKEAKQTFIDRKEFNAELVRRFTKKSPHRSISSVGAVKTPME